MLPRIVRGACILSIILVPLQYPGAQVNPQLAVTELAATELTAIADLVFQEADPAREAALLNVERGAHLYLQDILVPALTPPRLLLVVPLALGMDTVSRALALLADPSIAILFSAPRHDVADRSAPSLSPPGIGEEVPRIILGSGPRAEWRVAVPNRVAPIWLVRELRSAPEVALSPGRVNAALLGFGQVDPELRALLEAGLPAARLTIDERELATTLLAVGRTDIADRPGDRSYLVLPGGRSAIISEPLLVWSIATVAIGMLLFGIARPRRVHRYVMAIRHQAGLLILLFVILLVSLVLSNLVLRPLLRLPNVAGQTALLAIGKLTTGLIILATLFRVLHPRVGRASTAFTGAAIMFLVLSAIVSALFSLPAGAFFVAMTIFGFLFSLTARPGVKAIAFVLTLLPGIYLVVSLTIIADIAMTEALLTPPLIREIVTAVFLFPVLLMFFRLEILTPEVPILVVTTMLSLVGVAVIVATIVTGALESPTARLEVRETYPEGQSGEVSISSSIALGDEFVVMPQGMDEIRCDGSPCERPIEATAVPFSIEIERSSLLDRDAIRWRVDFEREARSMQIRIDTDSDVQLYASDIPSLINPIGTTARQFLLFPGPYPPPTSTGEFVVRASGAETRLVITVSAEFWRDGTRASSETAQIEIIDHAARWSATAVTTVEAR